MQEAFLYQDGVVKCFIIVEGFYHFMKDDHNSTYSNFYCDTFNSFYIPVTSIAETAYRVTTKAGICIIPKKQIFRFCIYAINLLSPSLYFMEDIKSLREINSLLRNEVSKPLLQSGHLTSIISNYIRWKLWNATILTWLNDIFHTDLSQGRLCLID